MYGLVRTDNQPIQARWGNSAIWITDLVTPKNPSVQLKYQELVAGLDSIEERVTALWYYVAHLPYRSAIHTTFSGGGKSLRQNDTWLFPCETIVVEQSNCANRTFLLASLLKNELPMPGQVYCSIGRITLDGIGNHAWVTADIRGMPHIIETTQPNLTRAFIPLHKADAYSAALHFDENMVYIQESGADPVAILNRHFGVCAIPLLHSYLCEKCLELPSP